jgi:hypothetical protein
MVGRISIRDNIGLEFDGKTFNVETAGYRR